jgi:hypothetical protein
MPSVSLSYPCFSPFQMSRYRVTVGLLSFLREGVRLSRHVAAFPIQSVSSSGGEEGSVGGLV